MKKRILSLMILSSLLMSCNESKEDIIDTEQDNKVQVVLMLGQSNMEGNTHSQYLIKTKGKTQKNMRDLTPEQVYEYAAEDADVTLKLKNKLEA